MTRISDSVRREVSALAAFMKSRSSARRFCMQSRRAISAVMVMPDSSVDCALVRLMRSVMDCSSVSMPLSSCSSCSGCSAGCDPSCTVALLRRRVSIWSRRVCRSARICRASANFMIRDRFFVVGNVITLYGVSGFDCRSGCSGARDWGMGCRCCDG